MADLMKKGYFIMDDGSKSSEHTAKPIKKASKSDKSNGVAPIRSQEIAKTNSKNSLKKTKK